MAFNRDYILTDTTLLEVADGFNPRAWLETMKSPLLDFDPLAGEKIQGQAEKWQINPKLFLVKLQVEQSLITKKPVNRRAYDWALGLGKTDSKAIAKFRGFGNQITAFGQLLSSYLDRANTYWVGDKVGKPWYVGDGMVVCKSLATAVLYRYTPWIGEKDHQKLKAPFGNFLLWLVARRWFPSLVVDE